MKKKELKVVIVAYCDYCKKELKGGYSSIEYKDGKVLDFCNEHTDKIDKTCLDKYKEKERAQQRDDYYNNRNKLLERQ